MDSPPPKKIKESTTISMVVERWKRGQLGQCSAVQRIGGYPWRLEIRKAESANKRWLNVQCLKSNEADLWECIVVIKTFLNEPLMKGCISSSCDRLRFRSWEENEESATILLPKLKIGLQLEVEISLIDLDDRGDKWRARPFLAPSDPRDGVLVIGEEKKKVEVNKESLATQSSFFDRLFNGDFMEKNMTEISIGDVEYEEFSNILKMIYGLDGVSLTDENVHRVLELADRFDLKIVEDRVVNYLLSSSTSFPLIQKLLITEDYNLPFLKDKVLDAFSGSEMKKLADSPEWDVLSKATTRMLFKKSCNNSFDFDLYRGRIY